MALGWMAPTSALGWVVRKANKSAVTSPSFTFRTDVQLVQMPAKKATGRLSSNANQAGGREPFGWGSGSAKLLQGTTHRLSMPSQRRQCAEAVLPTFVTPGSVFLSLIAKAGDGIPQRATASWRLPSKLRTIGAG